MTVLALPTVLRNPVDAATRIRRHRLTEANLLTAAVLVVYLVAAAAMTFHFDVIMEDALSRVSNAQYVLDSRQPKLSAVGFVWTPLPSFSYLPFLWLKSVWPGLVARGFLANIGSAVAMTFAVRTLLGILTDLGLRRSVRLPLAVLFALQPLIFFFGINGMTEAMLLAFVLLAVRRLIAWLAEPRPQHLVAGGLALAFGYLARYEVAAVGFAAVLLVFGVSWWRSRSGSRRWISAASDAALVGLPVAFTFLLWAAASFIVVGQPFAQFSSQYGNSALIANASSAAGGNGAVTAGPLTFIPTQWMVLAPLLLPVAIAVLVRSIRGRDLRAVVPLFLLGAVPLFETFAYLGGSLFGFLRYQIAVVPLFVLLVGCVLAPRVDADSTDVYPNERAAGAASATWPRRAQRSALSTAPVVIAVVALLSSSGLTAWAIGTSPRLASQEFALFRPMVAKVVHQPVANPPVDAWVADREVAAELDARHLGNGSVLLDSAAGFAVLAASHNPKAFTITSDSDFAGAVVDPVGHHVQYLLVCDRPVQVDAIARQWQGRLGGPKGVPWASLVTRFYELPGSAHQWSLWKVDPTYPVVPSRS